MKLAHRVCSNVSDFQSRLPFIHSRVLEDGAGKLVVDVLWSQLRIHGRVKEIHMSMQKETRTHEFLNTKLSNAPPK